MRNRRQNGGPPIGPSLRERLDVLAEALTRAEHLSPEQERELLEERARRLAAPPEEATAGGVVEVVTFAVGGERYAIETRHVREVVPLRGMVPVPNTPDFLLGVTSLRGEIVAVFDLRASLDIPWRGLADTSRLLVLGRDVAELALVAGEVSEIETLREEALLAPPDTISAGAREFIRGVTDRGLIVLDGAALLSTDRLFIDDNEANNGDAQWPERFH